MIEDIRAIINYAQSMKSKYPERASEIQTLSDIALLEIEDGSHFGEEYNKLVASIEDLIFENENNE